MPIVHPPRPKLLALHRRQALDRDFGMGFELDSSWRSLQEELGGPSKLYVLPRRSSTFQQPQRASDVSHPPFFIDDQPRTAAKGQIGPGPLEHYEQPILKPSQIIDVN